MRGKTGEGRCGICGDRIIHRITDTVPEIPEFPVGRVALKCLMSGAEHPTSFPYVDPSLCAKKIAC